MRDDQQRADQSKLFADVGEDEVGVRLRQIEELLPSFHQAEAANAAGADRNQRLQDVEAGAARVGFGIDEGQHARAPPGHTEEHVVEHRRRRRPARCR